MIQNQIKIVSSKRKNINEMKKIYSILLLFFTFSSVTDNSKPSTKTHLFDCFPKELLRETESILGCPDCTDSGGLFIEYSKNGFIQNWKIDLIKNNVPSYLHDFMDRVNKKIKLIND